MTQQHLRVMILVYILCHSIDPIWLEIITTFKCNVVTNFSSTLRQGELLRALGGVQASASLIGVPLGHNSSFLQGPAFAPPRIREAIWCGSTNSATEEGK